MSDYVLEVHFGDGHQPLTFELHGVDAEEAELKRQSLARDIEHAVEVEAPLFYPNATQSDPKAGVPIDPARVTSVDLVAAEGEST